MEKERIWAQNTPNDVYFICRDKRRKHPEGLNYEQHTCILTLMFLTEAQKKMFLNTFAKIFLIRAVDHSKRWVLLGNKTHFHMLQDAL